MEVIGRHRDKNRFLSPDAYYYALHALAATRLLVASFAL
jgi:hypothetical protein